jgi:hypothetical protein
MKASNIKSFRQYIQSAIEHIAIAKSQFSEATGFGGTTLPFVITQPMANLLTLITGTKLRARALNWMLSEGLLEATLNRNKLCEMINAHMRGQSVDAVLKMPPRIVPQNIQPSMRVVGEMARSAVGLSGEDPLHMGRQDEVRPCDVFSPEGRERFRLDTIKLSGGLGIDEYYDEHFEPKYMVIQHSNPGEMLRIELRAIRDALYSIGMEGFQYGGKDGYLQFMEKGDWLEPEARKAFSNNQQFGYSLEPESTVPTYDDNGNKVYHFIGGPSVPEEKRAEQTIMHMRASFHKIAGSVKQNQEIEDITPGEVDAVKRLLSSYQSLKRGEVGIRPIDVGVDTANAGKEGAARKLFDMNSGRGSPYMEVDPDMELDLILGLAEKGLHHEMPKREIKTWGGPMVLNKIFGREWDGTGNPPVTYWRTDPSDPNMFSCKIDPALVPVFMNAIKEGLSYNPPQLRVRLVLKNFLPKAAEAGLSKEVKLNLSTLVNAGIKHYPEAVSAVKRTIYKLHGFDQSSFATLQGFDRIKVNPLDQYSNDALQQLRKSGYDWEEKTESGAPDFLGRDECSISLGASRYKVVIDDSLKGLTAEQKIAQIRANPQAGLPCWLLVPVDRKGKPVKLARWGATGSAMLAGGHKHMGGVGTGAGHVETRPAGTKTWAQLRQLLLQGGLGENPAEDFGKVHYADETELPSVKESVTRAERLFGLKHNRKWPEVSQLYMWGIEALRSFSGDPAFQVGLLTDKQIEAELNWDEEKRRSKGEQKGWGIRVLLSNAGVNDPDQQVQLIDLMHQHGTLGGVIDQFSMLTPELLGAFGENAKYYRVRKMSQYIFTRMNEEYKKEQKRGSLTSLDAAIGGGDGGRTTSAAANVSKKGFGGGTGNDGEMRVITSDELRKNSGLPDLPPDEKYVPRHKGPVIPSQEPIPDTSGKKRAPRQSTQGGNQPAPVAPATTPAFYPKAPQKPVALSIDDDSELDNLFAQVKGSPPQIPQKPVALSIDDDPELDNLFRGIGTTKKLEHLDWRTYYKKFKETSAVYDSKVKPRNGSGFNWWGAVGNLGGTSISGGADTAKTDPVGKKGTKDGRAKN